MMNRSNMIRATRCGPRSGPGRFRGFTLIEVLIALAVLSIGLAGMAALQLSSLQYTHSAHYRSLATTIALTVSSDMLGRQSIRM